MSLLLAISILLVLTAICVGACVGVRGNRIKNIVDELAGERIDIVRWNESSPTVDAMNAIGYDAATYVERRCERVDDDDVRTVHLIDFRFAERHPDGLAHMVVERLSGPLGAVVYLVGVVALGVHLWHACQSVLQTLGFYHPRYRPMVVKAGWAVAVLVGLGFATFPLVIFTAPQSLGQPATESASHASRNSAAAELRSLRTAPPLWKRAPSVTPW